MRAYIIGVLSVQRELLTEVEESFRDPDPKLRKELSLSEEGL